MLLAHRAEATCIRLRTAKLCGLTNKRGDRGQQWGMDFYSAYQQGFVRVAACTQQVVLADPAANAAAVLELSLIHI